MPKQKSKPKKRKSASIKPSTTSSCDLDKFNNILKDIDDGVLVVTHNGCPACPPFMKEALKALKKAKKPVIEVEVTNEERDCLDLAKQLGVKATPTPMKIKNGKPMPIDIENKTIDQVINELLS